jgi:two-component system chemotaxis response regulator CheY
MPQILVVGAEDSFCLGLQEIVDSIAGQELGLRLKTTTSSEIASKWLELGGFAAVIFDPKLGFDQQSRLAGLLWDKNLISPFILYDPHRSLRHEAQSRLMGSEPFFGAGARSKLVQTLKTMANLAEKIGSPSMLRVAVVEDLDSPRDIICTYLEGVDHLQTIGFADVDSCLASLQADPSQFDFIITDIRMPKKSGSDLIVAIRADPKLKNIPVIVLTAYGTADAMVECLKAGATGFMVKPPKKKDLKTEIYRVRRILAYAMDPRMVFPHEFDRISEMLASKGLY